MGSRGEKEAQVSEIRDKLARANAAILADYRGLNVGQVTRLRRKLREAGVEYRVMKNTLIRLAARDVGLAGMEPYLQGPTAIALGYGDPVVPAKILSEFARDNKQLEIKAGVLQGRLIDAGGVKALADLPTREVILSRVLGGMRAPLAGMANVLVGPIRGFVYAVEALRKQKET